MEISIKDAAELLGKSERTVRHMAQTGRLPARRIGSRWLIDRDTLLTHGAADHDADTDTEPSAEVGNDADEAVTTDDLAVETAELDAAELSPPLYRVRRTDPDRVLPPGLVTSVRELESFHIATDLLADLAAVLRHTPDVHLRQAETHLREFLQLLADGCHADLQIRRARFLAAQTRACAVLTDLIHFNVRHPEPNLEPLCERIERDLIGSLRLLLGETQRYLSVRGRVLSLAERTVAQVLTRLRSFAGDGRFADRLGGLQRTLTQALHAVR